MVSMELKQSGVYVSRGLSFQNCTFDIVTADIDDGMRVGTERDRRLAFDVYNTCF